MDASELFAALALGGVGIFSTLWSIFICIILPTLAVAAFVIWIYFIIDTTRRDFPEKDGQTLWIILLVFGGVFASFFYYFMVMKKYPLKKS